MIRIPTPISRNFSIGSPFVGVDYRAKRGTWLYDFRYMADHEREERLRQMAPQLRAGERLKGKAWGYPVCKRDNPKTRKFC